MISVVDDDPSLLRALRRLLQTAGFAVEAFGSGEEFLQAQHSLLLDCVVLDINLGSLSGFAVQERMRAAGMSVPTVFITGHDGPATRERARKAGAAGYLAKPFEPEALISAIETALERS
jgi:FixJ family two-component response regulator